MAVLTRWIEGMRAKGSGRGEGELSRLCKARKEGDAEAEIMAATVTGSINAFAEGKSKLGSRM